MSDIHVLETGRYGNMVHVVMHFEVPAGDNLAGTPWRTIQSSRWNGEPSAVPTIRAAEQLRLENGEVYEHHFMFHSNPGETMGAKQARLEIAYAAERNKVVGNVLTRFSYWGYSHDVLTMQHSSWANLVAKLRLWLRSFRR